MLKFSNPKTRKKQVSTDKIKTILSADSFIEALTVINDTLETKKDALKKGRFFRIQLENSTIGDPKTLCENFLYEHFHGDIQSLVTEHKGLVPFLDYFIGSTNDACLEYTKLSELIEESLQNGSILAPYLLCKRMHDEVVGRQKNMLATYNVRDPIKKKQVQENVDELLNLSSLATILSALEASMDDEELQISREIHIMFSKPTSEHKVSFVMDSELNAYIRNEKLIRIQNPLFFENAKKNAARTIDSIYSLYAELSTSKGQMLMMSGLLPATVGLKFLDLQQSISIQASLPSAHLFAGMNILIKLYEMKDEIILLKTALAATEIYKTAKNELSLKVDYDLLDVNQALKDELFRDCAIIDTSASKKKALPVAAPKPKAEEIVKVDLTEQSLATLEPLKVSASVVTKPKPIEEEEEEETSAQSSVNYATSRKRTPEQRAQIAMDRDARRKIAIQTKLQITGKKPKIASSSDTEEINDYPAISEHDIEKYSTLFTSLFNINNNSFSRSDADTIFKGLNGDIKNRSGSHVSLYMPSKESGILRFIGGSSFHGEESGCAMLHSLQLLRNSVYNIMTPSALSKLQSMLGNNCYRPARAASVTATKTAVAKPPI